MNLPYYLGWRFTRLAAATYFRGRAYHAERVPTHGPFILAANHASFIDPPLVGAPLNRDIHYLARASLFRHPLANWLLRSCNSVPVERDGGGAAGLRAIFERLQAGAGIILFPEGTRSPDGRLQPARSGIGLIVIKSTCPVVPVRVFGTFEAFGRHLRFPRPKPVVVKYGQPCDFTALRAEARTCTKERLKAMYQEVADSIMRAIARLEPCADRTSFP
jgi:1-acyl-sn-glycerol-3-phosphate acyltransferase